MQTSYTQKEQIFYELSKYIDGSDYSSYTLQYPPPFLSDNQYDKSAILGSLKSLDEDTGLYIHIPFCNTKCTFCRYFSFVSKDQKLYDKYIDYLIRELQTYKDSFQPGQKFNSLYIGGGTPNIVGAKNVERLLKYIFENFSFTGDYQFCIEFNPHESDRDLLDVIKKYNCHRLTIGIQSMDDQVLKNINRDQTKKDVLRTIKDAQKIQIPYINVDLMLGIKGQTLQSFARDLKTIIALKVDMVHLHPFIPTDRTIDNTVSEETKETQVKMRELGIAMLQKAGYKSPEGDAMCLDKYSANKQLTDAIYGGKYLGAGVSAVGFVGEYRYINVPSVSGYFKKIDENMLPMEFARKLSKKDNMTQFMIYSMRYGSVSLEKFKSLFGEDLQDVFKKEISILEEKNKVSLSRDSLICRFEDIWDYLIFSKYFYDISIIDYYTSHIKK